MNRFCKSGVLTGLLLFFVAAMPGRAQLDNGVSFTTTFPFFVGETEMPPGSYMVTQTTHMDNLTLTITSTDGSHSAIVEVRPSTSPNTHARSVVTFNRYGKVDFLSAVWARDHMTEFKVIETNKEEQAALKTVAKQHTVAEQAQ